MTIKQSVGLFILLSLFLLFMVINKSKKVEIPWEWPIAPLVVAFLITLGNYLLWP